MTSTLSKDIFHFLLDSEGKRAMRYTYFFSVLTVEIDQSENSDFLGTLAKLIKESIRDTDLVGRIDDKRFSVILHHAEAPNTYSVGERIRDRVANYTFVFNESQQRRTVSVGGACFPSHTADIQGLLTTASEMLTKAKSLGGNKTHLPDM